MIISSTKRETRLSEDGRLPGAGSAHLGPGKYATKRNTIAGRRRKPAFSSFGSAPRNLVPIKEGPGPAKFQKNQFKFDAHIGAKPTSVFKMKQPRFAESSKLSTLGPGHYGPMQSDFDRSLLQKTKLQASKVPSKAPIVKHEPTAPSVPRIEQSFGYRESGNGKLVRQAPPASRYGGGKLGNPNDVNDRTSWIRQQIKDTVGPAYYDAPNTTAFADASARKSKPGKTVGGHVPFAKSKYQRKLFEAHKGAENSFPDPENPGPGHYSHVIKVRPRNNKHLSSSFASGVPQLHDAQQKYKASLPGPSIYRPVDSSLVNKVEHAGVPSFGSHTDRSEIGPEGDIADVPGPGAYDALVGTFETVASGGMLGGIQLSDVETAFGSTATRPCLAPTKQISNVGPGDYGDSRTFSGLTQNINRRATIGTRGVFSTTTRRFQPGSHLDGSKIRNTPGVGRYRIKNPRYQRSRELSAFQSTSTRRARPATGNPDYVMVGKYATPAPGQYDLKASLAIGGSSAMQDPNKIQVSFDSKEPRAKPNEIFGKSIAPTPGPGDYSGSSGTLAEKIYGKRAATANFGIFHRSNSASAAGGGFGASTIRFQKNNTALDLSTTVDQHSMIKKSFNTKTGYKPTKPADKRIHRARKGGMDGFDVKIIAS